MGVIKSSEAPVTATAFSMQDIETAAKRILLRARIEAAQIVAAGQAEGQNIKRQAQIQGVEEGRLTGIAEGKKTGHAQALAEHGAAMTKLIATLTEGVRQLDQSREELAANGLQEVIKLACAIAQRIARRQAKLDPQVLCENLKEAMTLATHAADVRLCIAPSQMQTLQQELPHLRLAWPQLKHVELTEDASLQPGDLRIHTVHGQVDATLDAQLDRLAAELMPDPGILASSTAPSPNRAAAS